MSPPEPYMGYSVYSSCKCLSVENVCYPPSVPTLLISHVKKTFYLADHDWNCMIGNYSMIVSGDIPYSGIFTDKMHLVGYNFGDYGKRAPFDEWRAHFWRILFWQYQNKIANSPNIYLRQIFPLYGTVSMVTTGFLSLYIHLIKIQLKTMMSAIHPA